MVNQHSAAVAVVGEGIVQNAREIDAAFRRIAIGTVGQDVIDDLAESDDVQLAFWLADGDNPIAFDRILVCKRKNGQLNRLSESYNRQIVIRIRKTT